MPHTPASQPWIVPAAARDWPMLRRRRWPVIGWLRVPAEPMPDPQLQIQAPGGWSSILLRARSGATGLVRVRRLTTPTGLSIRYSVLHCGGAAPDYDPPQA